MGLDSLHVNLLITCTIESDLYCKVSRECESCYGAGAQCGMPARMRTWGALPAGGMTWSPWHTPSSSFSKAGSPGRALRFVL